MRKGTILIGMFAALVALAAFAMGQTAQEHIQKGDEFYAQFDDQKALEEYKQAVALEPANYEALWKFARAMVDTADLVDPKEKGAQDKQKKMYGEAESAARKAIAANPNDTWGHFTLSSAMGKRLLLLGKKEQIEASHKVKGIIEKAIELDATNDLAFHALGRWHRRIAEIGGAKRFFGSLIYGSIPKGSFEESAQFLEKAVELRPGYINHHYELGLTYLALEKKDKAAEEFQKCLDLEKTSSKDDMIKGWARAELGKLKKG